jgi:hypothetical protein
VFDRLEVAASTFHPLGWESNLRPLVPWWLDALQQPVLDRAVSSLIARVRRNRTSSTGHYQLLGLMDWMCAHPEHPRAEDGLQLGLDGRDGMKRKAAVDLSAAMGRSDTLERFVRDDPDKSVRIRAQKLLDDLRLDRKV